MIPETDSLDVCLRFVKKQSDAVMPLKSRALGVCRSVSDVHKVRQRDEPQAAQQSSRMS